MGAATAPAPAKGKAPAKAAPAKGKAPAKPAPAKKILRRRLNNGIPESLRKLMGTIKHDTRRLSLLPLEKYFSTSKKRKNYKKRLLNKRKLAKKNKKKR